MGKDPVKRVSYESRSHQSVLCQMYGSAWPNVLPFCLLNMLWIALIEFLKHHTPIDISFHSLKGHSIMAILVRKDQSVPHNAANPSVVCSHVFWLALLCFLQVSFLVVSRITMTYTNFKLAREYLSVCFKSCRSVAHLACLLTRYNRSEGAQRWRSDVAFQSIMMLRIMTCANEHDLTNPDHPHGSWIMVPDDIQEKLGFLDDSTQTKWSHGRRLIENENFRAPTVMAFFLQETIVRHREEEYCGERLAVNEELRILESVQEFLAGYHGIHEVITTAFPFPLAQMTRTFLFFWTFTLPMALVNTGPMWQVMVIMFFVTYGFIGLEYVSIEMDDPFGDDPNDFDDWGMAQVIIEDIYISIFNTDGVAAAKCLRRRVVDQIRYAAGTTTDLEAGN